MPALFALLWFSKSVHEYSLLWTAQSDFGGCYCSLGVIGQADCPQVNGDCYLAWNPEFLNAGEQYIDVKYREAVFITQVEVYIPSGGQQLVAVHAWNYESNSWVEVFSATDCQVSVATDASAELDYVVIGVNPCKTTFRSDMLRLIFDTDLTRQWLMVDAVKLYGTRDPTMGMVTNQHLMLQYIPDASVYGVDSFTYVLTDCAGKDERSTEEIRVFIDIQGIADPPFISPTTYSVHGEVVLSLVASVAVIRIDDRCPYPCR